MQEVFTQIVRYNEIINENEGKYLVYCVRYGIAQDREGIVKELEKSYAIGEFFDKDFVRLIRQIKRFIDNTQGFIDDSEIVKEIEYSLKTGIELNKDYRNAIFEIQELTLERLTHFVSKGYKVIGYMSDYKTAMIQVKK